MKSISDRQIRLTLVPVVIFGLLTVCSGHMAGQTITEEMIREAGSDNESVLPSTVTGPGHLERWTPTMRRPSAADLMIMPTAERLAYRMGQSPAASEPASMSTGYKIAVATLTAVRVAVVTLNDIFTSFHRDFCLFCGTQERQSCYK